MESKSPKVSVVIPVFRQRKDWFDIALRAIYGQSYPNIEIIVSTVIGDPAYDWAHAYPNVKRVDNRVANAKAQINTGIKIASGEYIVVAGSDDKFYPNAIADMVKVAVNKDAVIVYSGIHYADENLSVVYTHKAPEFSWQKLKQSQFINDCALVRKDVLWEFGLYDEKWMKFAPWDMWFNIAAKYEKRIHPTGKIQLIYRRHEKSLSIRAFRGDLEKTGEHLRAEFFEKHNIEKAARVEFVGNEIRQIFDEKVKIPLDKSLKNS